jgi:diacylglycerol kinase family enzyme
VAVVKTECMRVSGAEGTRVHADRWESVGRLPAEIRVVPDALTLMVPETYGA